MNFRRLLLLLFSVYVLSFALFSNSFCVQASEDDVVDIDDIEINTSYFNGHEVYVYDANLSLFSNDLEGYTVSSWYKVKGGSTWISFTNTATLDKSKKYDFYFLVYYPNLLEKDSLINTSFSFSYSGLNVQNISPQITFYKYNSSDTFSESVFDWNWKNNVLNINSHDDINVKFESDRMNFFINDVSLTSNGISLYVNSISMNKVSDSGLLNNIFGGIKDVFKSITELPGKLSEMILNGIKSLFVPTDEDITSQQTKWDDLLSSRFGCLYQVFDVIKDYCSYFLDDLNWEIHFNNGKISIPKIDLNLCGSTFSIGGWQVPVVVSGFEFIFDSIKLVTSILCTLLFVNSVKKRFDKLLGGSSDL